MQINVAITEDILCIIFLYHLSYRDECGVYNTVLTLRDQHWTIMGHVLDLFVYCNG